MVDHGERFCYIEYVTYGLDIHIMCVYSKNIHIRGGSLMLERLFQLQKHNTTVRREIFAGVTTFMTMAYIIFVNPDILSTTGMPFDSLVVATCLAAAIGTLLMGFLANYPFALAPGMGLNAFFAFYVVGVMGLSWQAALAAVFVSGIIFLLLTVTNVREAIVNAIPTTLKLAVSAGIGLFIALIGFFNTGIVVIDAGTLLPQLGDFTSPTVLLSVFGLAFTAILVARRVKGALLWGILATTVLGMIVGQVDVPTSVGDLVQAPPSLSPIFFKFDFKELMGVGLLTVIFSFTFVDMFDTIGTLVGVASKADLLDEKGNLPKANKALLADSLGTIAGSVLGTSTVTTYVESASGVAEGGRTGLTAVTTAVLFLASVFFTPLVGLVKSFATGPILIIVGVFMMEPVMKIKFSDYMEAIPAFLAIVMMPFTYSIAEGIVWGTLSYVLLRVGKGRFDEIHPVMYVLSALFILRFIVDFVLA